MDSPLGPHFLTYQLIGNGSGIGTVAPLPVMAFTYLILAITGSVCNFIIILGITSCKLLWKPTYFFILNIAVSDLLICAVCCPFQVYALLYCAGPLGCHVIGMLMNVFMIASLIGLSALALNRYMLIKLSSDKYQAYFMCHRICLSTLIIWTISLLYLLPLMLHGTAGYDKELCICASTSRQSGRIVDIIQALFLGFPALCIIYFSYLQIWRTFKSSVQSLDLPANKRAVNSFKLSRNLFIVTTLFTICWLPSFMLMIFDSDFQAPPLMHQWASLMAIMHSTVNPVSYLVLNRNLTSAYYGMVVCCQNNHNVQCCGCWVYCIQGRPLPAPSSTAGVHLQSAVRRLSSHVFKHLRANSLVRKISDPSPNAKEGLHPSIARRRTSEPLPLQHLNIVPGILRSPESTSSTGTRRTLVSLESPPVIKITQFMDGTKYEVLDKKREESNTACVKDHMWENDKLGAVNEAIEVSTSDSGCEIIPLEPLNKKGLTTSAEIH